VSERTLVLDSSIWVEILNRGPLAKMCTKELNNARQVYVPTLVIFEVYRKIASATSEDQALSAIAALSQHEVVDLTREVALSAADLSIQHKLAMADSLVLAHAHQTAAVLLTLDNDFSGIPGVQVLRRQ
jgi:toxin FitB